MIDRFEPGVIRDATDIVPGTTHNSAKKMNDRYRLTLSHAISGLLLLLLTACSGDSDHRKIHIRGLDQFTPEKLADVPDSEVIDYLFVYVANITSHNPSREGDIVHAMPEGFQVIYTTRVLENEVNNGGFHQYFWNHGEAIAPETHQSLIALGLEDVADLYLEAVQTAREEAEEQAGFRDGTMESFAASARGSALNGLDMRFYDMEVSFEEKRLAYVRRYPDRFMGGGR